MAPAGKPRAGRVDREGEVWITGYTSDPELPEPAPSVAGRLVVHRFHRRVVVLIDDRVIKSIHQNRANAVAVQSPQVAELRDGSGVAATWMLTHSPSRVELALLPGHTPHDLGGDVLPGWRRSIETWPGLVTHLAGLPEHTGADEANVLWRWFGSAREHRALPSLDRLGTKIVETCWQPTSGDDDTHAFTHRDPHDKQLLWDGITSGLLDPDAAARGEAALDLGNLWAHVELRHTQRSLEAQERDRILTLLLGSLVEVPPTTPGRVAAYHRAARLWLAFVYVFRPRPIGWLSH